MLRLTRKMTSRWFAYVLFVGAIGYSSTAVLSAHGCCSDSAGCWEMHDWDTNYMCCTACAGTGPCLQGSAEGYCKDTGGDWCPPCMEG